MFGIFKKGKAPRALNAPKDLRVGDKITLRLRDYIPTTMQGETYTVTRAGCYRYTETLYLPEFELEAANGDKYGLQVDENGDAVLSLYVHPEKLLTLFGEESLGDLLDETMQAKWSLTGELTERMQGWVDTEYRETLLNGEGEYYAMPPEQAKTAGAGDYVRGSEMTSINDQKFSIAVEVWQDGETDCFFCLSVPNEFIESYWPGSE
ncbi:hypothetical protein [Salinibius halmophilus]|uniref:hypothetical protein n=1 Tax=Salinibius halmophilus TaxID=1853216 RepID=UPI000E673D91|nr:hypothetical protein [Salinibius halmophilus]